MRLGKDLICILRNRLYLLFVSGFLITSVSLVFAQGMASHRNQRLKINLPTGKSAASFPYIDFGIHDNGYLWTTVINNGIIGNIFRFELPSRMGQAPSFYFPRLSRIQHGYYAALWVGGVVNRDTLVSVAMDVNWYPWNSTYPMEFWPDVYPFGEIETRSSDSMSSHYHPRADADLEFKAVYTDTFERESWLAYNSYDNRSHKPLNLKVTQTTYSWPHKYTRDFIIVDYNIVNLGVDTIKDAWAGIYYVGCVHHRGEQPYPPSDDIVSYIYSVPYEFEELGNELMRITYIVDNDGKSFSNSWSFLRTANTFAIAPLRVPEGAFINNFNWWTDQYGSHFNWGPRQTGSLEYPFRMFSGGLGNPYSDRDKYYLMSKPEVDYSGYEAAVDHTDDGWLPPHPEGEVIARGHLPEYVTSFGPFTMPPGEAAVFTVVMTIGENVHYNQMAYRNMFSVDNPAPFMKQLDFNDLITNVRWAKVVFDNPGIDTDLDGDSGKYFWRYEPATGESLCVYYEGDGVPDFRGATSPPPPEFRVIPEEGRIVVRWNGRNTENFYDPLSLARDFEGYRVYIARSPTASEAILLTSFDHENYNRHIWDATREQYLLTELPFTIDSLQALYGQEFDPMDYTYSHPLIDDDKTCYFSPVDYNQYDLSNIHGIHKLYPEATLDTNDVDDEGRMRYYEYEYIIENLLPTVPYYVSVTAFDFGHPPKSLEPMESRPEEKMIEVFANRQVPQALKNGKLNVYCYPNPYRTDANYAGRGFEDRLGETSPERARSIHFANLPDRCTISIFSLDGDLVRELRHDEPEGSGTASVHRWDIIGRNTQSVVPGLYYWVVESEYGNQIGKLVIIK
ncbi:MAG: hypothetical protein U9R56_01390 [candidate division Zixibacteria bacterium]|nr:hypothetical protein [candidate division Zixibacteria bacterium]